MVAEKPNPLEFTELFPPFGEVKPEHVEPGIRAHLETAKAALKDLEAKIEADLAAGTITYEAIARQSEFFDDRLSRAWGVVKHLKSVNDSPELRAAVDLMQPAVIEFGLEMGQSTTLYKAWKFIQEQNQSGKIKLSPSQERVVKSEVLGAELSGVALEGAGKEKYNANAKRMGDLKTKFNNNLQDATKAFTVRLTTKAEVAGLPESALALAAQTAKSKQLAEGDENATGGEGPWVMTLDYPSYLPVMQHSTDRELRRNMHKAHMVRASEFTEEVDKDSGERKDNTPLIMEILKLRKENSALLGYENYARQSMAKKMATLETALKLIEDLRTNSYDAGVKELEELQKFAESKGFPAGEQLKQWDVPFYAERLKEERYEFNEEELKPYFSLPKVEAGLFGLAKKLFGVDIKELDAAAEGISLWHKDVKVFEIQRDGKTISYFYLDPYSRPETKKGGAWMDECAGRTENELLLDEVAKSKNGGVRLPIAHMVCNQTPPVGDEPSLMTFREVETLFHEFGHALQHMLTKEKEGSAAGIRGVEWDAVEEPSQFMENWCYDKTTMDGMAKHYKTGELIPDELFGKLKRAKTYRAASMMLRQLHFAYVDLKLHSSYSAESLGSSEKTIWDLEKDVAQKFDVIPLLDYDRFLCGFGHIFAGGYAAGYFSYKWAEVLSADCFQAFEEAGLDNEKAMEETGRRFADTVLGLGGGVAPLEVFKRFRGREPKVDALLIHNGLMAG